MFTTRPQNDGSKRMPAGSMPPSNAGRVASATVSPARLPEFRGNVTAVFTENYWDLQLTELSSRMDRVNAKRDSLGNDKTLSAEEKKKLVEDYKAKVFTKEELRILETGTPIIRTTRPQLRVAASTVMATRKMTNTRPTVM